MAIYVAATRDSLEIWIDLDEVISHRMDSFLVKHLREGDPEIKIQLSPKMFAFFCISEGKMFVKIGRSWTTQGLANSQKMEGRLFLRWQR